MTIQMGAGTRRRSSKARLSPSVLAFLASASLSLVLSVGSQPASATTRGAAGGALPTAGTTGPARTPPS
jgi:hypothetical protein